LQLSTVVVFFQTALLAVTTSRFSAAYAAGNSEEIRRLATQTMRWIVLLAFPIVVFIAVWGQPLLAKIFGAEYAQAHKSLLVLTVAQVFHVVGGVALTVLKMTGAETKVLKVAVTALCVNVILAVLLSFKIG